MRTIILFVLLLFLGFQAEAKYSQTCTVKYKTQKGWSKNYTVTVTFLTGSELNEATGTYNYTGFSVYGVIFWSKGQATVIKISSFLSCGSEVSQSCITNNILNLNGNDQDGDKWEICTSNYCY